MCLYRTYLRMQTNRRGPGRALADCPRAAEAVRLT